MHAFLTPIVDQMVNEQKRAEHFHREQQRWDHMQGGVQKQEQFLQQQRLGGTAAQRNQSGEHYNILTLQHQPTPGGQALMQQVRGGSMGAPWSLLCINP